MSDSRGLQRVSPVESQPVRRFPRPVDDDVEVVVEVQPAILRLENVSKVFSTRGAPDVRAVSSIDLDIGCNSITLLQGPSGSGKTTLLSLIACMARPTEGRIRVGGQDVTRFSEDLLAEVRRRTFGIVFQKHHLVRGATALDNVMIPGLPLPGWNGDLRSHALDLLARFGLGGRAAIKVERLSGGEQQRVAIARALINDPEIVIADEPTAQLDSEAALGVIDLIGELNANGKTVVVASHDPVLCRSGRFTQVVRMRDGRVV